MRISILLAILLVAIGGHATESVMKLPKTQSMLLSQGLTLHTVFTQKESELAPFIAELETFADLLEHHIIPPRKLLGIKRQFTRFQVLAELMQNDPKNVLSFTLTKRMLVRQATLRKQLLAVRTQLKTLSKEDPAWRAAQQQESLLRSHLTALDQYLLQKNSQGSYLKPLIIALLIAGGLYTLHQFGLFESEQAPDDRLLSGHQGFGVKQPTRHPSHEGVGHLGEPKDPVPAQSTAGPFSSWNARHTITGTMPRGAQQVDTGTPKGETDPRDAVEKEDTGGGVWPPGYYSTSSPVRDNSGRDESKP